MIEQRFPPGWNEQRVKALTDKNAGTQPKQLSLLSEERQAG